ncbi:MAG: DnaB-like helicase terminal domain [Actinomycetota bacterium]|nr:DnaB-like helicase terminal domain [Actinomycetota bacterium]
MERASPSAVRTGAPSWGRGSPPATPSYHNPSQRKRSNRNSSRSSWFLVARVGGVTDAEDPRRSQISDSTDRGVAEIIVAKHRNGPTAKIRLAFLEHLTRFADL